MNWQLSGLLTLLLFGLSTPGLGEIGTKASVRDLIVVGLEQNIGLKASRLNVPIATTTIVETRAFFDPELFATTAYLQSTTPLTSSLSPIDQSEADSYSAELGVRKKTRFGLLGSLSVQTEWNKDNDLNNELDPRYRSSLNLTLSQPLLRNFGREVNTIELKTALERRGQASLRHRFEAQSLAVQIELSASEFAGDARIVALRAEAVALARALLRANQQRFQTGVIPISEVQEAETALANRELSFSQAGQSLQLNYENLNRQLNFTLPEDFNASALYSFPNRLMEYQLPSSAQLYESARRKNLQLQIAAVDIRTAELQQDFYRNQLKPTLDLNLQAGLNGLSGSNRDATTANRYAGSWPDSFSRSATADGYQWRAGLEFSIPLGNRSAKAKLRQSALQRKQASYLKQDIEAELRRDLQQEVISLRRAYEQVKIAERFEQLAETSLQQEQRRLEEGLSDTFRVLAFQDNMIDAKIGRINALIQFYTTQARLNFIRGTILEQHNISLAQPAEESSLEIM